MPPDAASKRVRRSRVGFTMARVRTAVCGVAAKQCRSANVLSLKLTLKKDCYFRGLRLWVDGEEESSRARVGEGSGRAGDGKSSIFIRKNEPIGWAFRGRGRQKSSGMDGGIQRDQVSDP
jgi:hypothetical protein